MSSASSQLLLSKVIMAPVFCQVREELGSIHQNRMASMRGGLSGDGATSAL